MAESMLAANPILKQQLPKPSGNVGIGYAQGALNIGTQNKATESLNVEKAEGEISQTNLNAAKAELAKQQGILSTKTAERASKQQEKAAKEQERAEAQRRVEEANRRLAEARAAAERARAEAEARAAAERARAEAEARAAAARAAASQPQGSYTPAQTYIPPAPVYTPPPTPAPAPKPAPVAAAAPLPSYTVEFWGKPTSDSGSASSAMRAAMGKVYQKPTIEEMEREARAAEWFRNQATMI